MSENDRTVVRTTLPAGGYRYTTQTPTPSGGFKSEPATELDWLTAELARLADVRAGDADEGPDDFTDALAIAESLRCMIDDLVERTD